MTEAEAKRYISGLTIEEKQKLNELLKALEQKRLPSPSPQESAISDGR